jgi:hypothetical protein
MNDVSEVLSGQSGIVAGRRQRARAVASDLADFAIRAARLESPRLRRAATKAPPRSVLVTGVYGAASARAMAALVRNLERSKHELTFALGSLDSTAPKLASQTALDSLGGGKFENVNALLATVPDRDPDWTLVVDDDIELPAGFLGRFLFCVERFGFQLAQPALTQASHAAWDVMRRRHRSVARQTRMVEIGPLTAFHRSLARELLPFPDLRMGWGLDSYWGGLALERGWKLGVVDATAIRHQSRQTAATYDRAEAVAEAERFLAGRPQIDRATALSVVQEYRSWR